MSPNDPSFWILVIVAVSFLVIATAMVIIALVVSRVTRSVSNLERRVEPLIERMGTLGDQVRQIAFQGKEIASQLTQVSEHLSTATLHFSETTALIKDEVRELKQLAGYSAVTARDKVEMISRGIDHTQQQMMMTTSFIHSRILEPAREIAAIMAGLRRGLEVLIAPLPKPVNQTYGEDELFIG